MSRRDRCVYICQKRGSFLQLPSLVSPAFFLQTWFHPFRWSPGQLGQFLGYRMVDTQPHEMIPALNRLEVQGDLETEAISRNAKAEKFHPNGSLREKPAFPIRRNPTLLPIPQGSIRIRPVRESCQSTLFTPDLTSTKNPEIQRAAACAFIHTPNIVVLQYVINMFSATLLTYYNI